MRVAWNFKPKCLIPCMTCGTIQERSKWLCEKHSLVFCNASCQVKWQNSNTEFNKGANNPSYTNGLRVGGKLATYGDDFNIKLKREMKIRDGFNCQKCHENFSGKKSIKLDVHHIDLNKYNNDPSNLTCLCKQCHTKVHWELGK